MEENAAIDAQVAQDAVTVPGSEEGIASGHLTLHHYIYQSSN